MIRTLPVDTNRLQLIAASAPIASPEWVELSDGSRRPSGNQSKDDDGRLVWIVDCLASGGDRAEVIGVQVVGDEPQVEPLQPVRFEGLEVRVAKTKAGVLAGYWSASAVMPSRNRPVPSSPVAS